MAQFQFSLEKVLRWRAIELTRQEVQLQRILQERTRLQMIAARLSGERAQLTTSISTLPNLRGEDLRAMAAHGLRLRQQMDKLAQLQARCQRELAAQQKKYADAKMRHKLLEELRARQHARWQYEEDRQLETLATDSYLAVWNREEE